MGHSRSSGGPVSVDLGLLVQGQQAAASRNWRWRRGCPVVAVVDGDTYHGVVLSVRDDVISTVFCTTTREVEAGDDRTWVPDFLEAAAWGCLLADVADARGRVVLPAIGLAAIPLLLAQLG